ncbi:MAG: hypothetical protein LUC17_00630 [Oscillospiraceae bacterium]|nr:hypothetical protein [Oscillospiraceae bacterium]
MKRHSHLIVFILQMIIVLAYIVFAVSFLFTIPDAMVTFQEEGILIGDDLAAMETIFRVLLVYIPIFALVWTAAWGIAGYVRRWNRNRTTVFASLACVGVLPLLFDLWLISLFALVCGVIYLAVIVFFIIYSRY